MPTDTRNPTGDFTTAQGGVSQAWAGAAEGSRWALVDDYPDAGNPIADGLTHGTTAGHIQFSFTPFTVPVGATSISIQVLYYAFRTASQSSTISAELRIGSSPTPHGGTQTAPPQGNAAIATRTVDFTTNPKSGTAWTVNDVNGVGTNGLVGFGWVSTDASPTITVSSIRLQVTYSNPPVARRPPRPSGHFPSLAHGYARDAGHSDAPAQWRGLVSAYAPFLGHQGETLWDVSSGFHGTLTAMTPATAYQPGRHGSALSFDGVNDYIVCTNLRTFTGRASVALWFSTTQGTVSYLYSDFAAGQDFFQIQLNNTPNTVMLVVSNGTNLAIATSPVITPADGQWHQAVGTYNGLGVAILYVDGVQVATGTQALVGLYTCVTAPKFGSEDGTTPFYAGLLDDVRVYDRVLSAGEVLEQYRDPYAMYRLRRRRLSVQVSVVAPPTITDVETDEQFADTDTGVTITGTDFGATQGTGTVELASTSTYATATKVSQTVTSWGNTAIDFTAGLGGLTPGTLYLFVTNNSSLRNTAFAVTVDAAAAPSAVVRSLMLTGVGR